MVPRGGFVGGSEAKLAVGPKQGRRPDLTVYLAGTPLPPASGIIAQPPDIAIEIVSPTPRDGRRDRVEKVVDYAAFRVRYYWIVDPQLRSLEILRLGPQGRYEHLLGATEGQVDIPACDGFVLDLDAVWAEVERFEAREAENKGVRRRAGPARAGTAKYPRALKTQGRKTTSSRLLRPWTFLASPSCR